MRKIIELSRVRPGEIFSLDGVEFARLPVEETGAILVVTADVLPENVQFENDNATREDHNNFVGSMLEYAMGNWLGKHEPIFEACVLHPVDLTTMDGMTDYGMPSLLVRPLTVEEYRSNRAYIPLASRAWWTATGWTSLRSRRTDSYFAYVVNIGGTLNDSNVNFTCFSPRPALYLKSSTTVSIEDGKEKKDLSGYTELDLLAELQRRAENVNE